MQASIVERYPSYGGVYCMEEVCVVWYIVVCVVWRCPLHRCVHGMEVSIDGGVYCIEVCVVWRCLLCVRSVRK